MLRRTPRWARTLLALGLLAAAGVEEREHEPGARVGVLRVGREQFPVERGRLLGLARRALQLGQRAA